MALKKAWKSFENIAFPTAAILLENGSKKDVAELYEISKSIT